MEKSEGKKKYTPWDYFRPDPPEEMVYENHFKNKVWTVKEFAALFIGITPEKFEELNNNLLFAKTTDYWKRLNLAHSIRAF